MAKSRNKRKNGSMKDRWLADVRPETKRSVAAILFFVLATFFVLAVLGKAGWAGELSYRLLTVLFGKGFFIVPAALVLAGVALLIVSVERTTFFVPNVIGVSLFLAGIFGLLEFVFEERVGGFAGFVIAWPFRLVVDRMVGIIVTLALVMTGFLVMFNASIVRRSSKKEGGNDEKSKGVIREAVEKSTAVVVQAKEAVAGPLKETLKNAAQIAKDSQKVKEAEIFRLPKKVAKLLPPLELLSTREGKPSSGDLKANANIIKRTLETFGIPVEMGEVNVGPTVTQYTLKPAEGVKLSKITTLHSDLSLALAAHPIRIEAPIPGKSLVGIEIPNKSAALVGLRSLLEENEFQSSPQPLLFALGRDVSGKPVFADIARMPHLLVAGATGTGKSVVLHVLVTSLVYRNLPDRVKFLMIDPKRVELTVYNGLPHLLTPVVVDGEKAMKSLKWVVTEMEHRYEILSAAHTRDIVAYNQEILKKGAKALDEVDEPEFMPYLVVIIDELADLMAAWARDVETSVIRIAQMARAVGIHLVVSTQRPSVEVITGLIKANITSRVALQVASQIDSRTILDMAGAEKLLGNGDMLYLAGDVAKPRRLQGAYIGHEELGRVVDFYAKGDFETQDVDVFQEVTLAGEGSMYGGEVDDVLYHEAVRTVRMAGKASASLLQRRLKVGYARAARLLDIMEEHGIIGPGEGAKPREVYLGSEEGEEGVI